MASGLVACIEAEEHATLTPLSVQGVLRERLAHFKTPKEIYFLPSLPREATGKIFKRELREGCRQVNEFGLKQHSKR
jgi:acyl-coenzyme A synthetase/AMP-(fatty) acid ligase